MPVAGSGKGAVAFEQVHLHAEVVLKGIALRLGGGEGTNHARMEARERSGIDPDDPGQMVDANNLPRGQPRVSIQQRGGPPSHAEQLVTEADRAYPSCSCHGTA